METGPAAAEAEAETAEPGLVAGEVCVVELGLQLVGSLLVDPIVGEGIVDLGEDRALRARRGSRRSASPSRSRGSTPPVRVLLNEHREPEVVRDRLLQIGGVVCVDVAVGRGLVDPRDGGVLDRVRELRPGDGELLRRLRYERTRTRAVARAASAAVSARRRWSRRRRARSWPVLRRRAFLSTVVSCVLLESPFPHGSASRSGKCCEFHERRQAERKRDREGRAVAVVRLRGDRSAVRLGDRGDDREAEPDASTRARPRRISAVEPLEDVREPASGASPGPESATTISALPFRRRPITPHRSRRRRVRADVREQVVDDLAQPVAVADHDCLLGVELDRPLRLDGACRVDRLGRRARRARPARARAAVLRRAGRAAAGRRRAAHALGLAADPVIERARSSGRSAAPRVKSSA